MHPTMAKKPSAQDDVATEMDAWTAPVVDRRKKQAERPKTITNKSMERAANELQAFMTSGEWGGAKPLHFVALFAWLHEKVYQVHPVDLTPEARMTACGMASAMLKRDFSDDPAQFATFLRWVWTREREREAWRRENNRDGGSIGWRFQFAAGSKLVVDYRLHLARKGAL